MDTTTFAIIDDTQTITEILELPDEPQAELAHRYGHRFVYLPMGGEVGDVVEVDEDGEATVVPPEPDVGVLPQTPIGEGDGWSVFLAHDQARDRWAVVSECGEDALGVDVDWYDTRAAAEAQARDVAESLREGD